MLFQQQRNESIKSANSTLKPYIMQSVQDQNDQIIIGTQENVKDQIVPCRKDYVMIVVQ